MVEHAAERRIAEEQAGAHDDRVNVLVLVSALRCVRRKTREDLGGRSDQAGTLGRVHLGGDRQQVVAPVAVGGELEALAAFLEVAQPGARRENLHLAAGIVHVILARRPKAHGVEQIGDARAIRRVPAVSHVQGTGGIRRDEFHQHAPAAAQIGAAIRIPELENAPDLGVIGALVQEEIDESGAGDLDLGHRRMGGQRGFDGFGDLARVLARSLREAHGDVPGEVAMGGVARALHFDVDGALRGGYQGFGQRGERLPQQGLDQALQGKIQVEWG